MEVYPYLFSHGASDCFDLMKQDGLTTLHTAIIGKKEPVISHILRKGANPNVADRVREFPISFVIDLSSSIFVYIWRSYG